MSDDDMPPLIGGGSPIYVGLLGIRRRIVSGDVLGDIKHSTGGIAFMVIGPYLGKLGNYRNNNERGRWSLKSAPSLYAATKGLMRVEKQSEEKKVTNG